MARGGDSRLVRHVLRMCGCSEDSGCIWDQPRVGSRMDVRVRRDLTSIRWRCWDGTRRANSGSTGAEAYEHTRVQQYVLRRDSNSMLLPPPTRTTDRRGALSGPCQGSTETASPARPWRRAPGTSSVWCPRADWHGWVALLGLCSLRATRSCVATVRDRWVGGLVVAQRVTLRCAMFGQFLFGQTPRPLHNPGSRPAVGAKPGASELRLHPIRRSSSSSPWNQALSGQVPRGACANGKETTSTNNSLLLLAHLALGHGPAPRDMDGCRMPWSSRPCPPDTKHQTTEGPRRRQCVVTAALRSSAVWERFGRAPRAIGEPGDPELGSHDM